MSIIFVNIVLTIADTPPQKNPTNATQHIAAARRNQEFILGKSLVYIAPKPRRDATHNFQRVLNALEKKFLVLMLRMYVQRIRKAA